MYRIIKPDIENHFDVINRLINIADRAWHGYSLHSIAWRRQYYFHVMKNRLIAPHIFRLIEHYNDKEDITEDCAFVVVYPMKPEIFRLHLAGKLSQYDFESDYFSIEKRKNSQSAHYIQSIFIEKDYRNSLDLKQHFKSSVGELLKEQRCGAQNRNYFLYAETGIQGGKLVAMKRGFKKLDSKSCENHDFFLFNSATDSGSIKSEIAALWSKK